MEKYGKEHKSFLTNMLTNSQKFNRGLNEHQVVSIKAEMADDAADFKLSFIPVRQAYELFLPEIETNIITLPFLDGVCLFYQGKFCNVISIQSISKKTKYSYQLYVVGHHNKDDMIKTLLFFIDCCEFSLNKIEKARMKKWRWRENQP